MHDVIIWLGAFGAWLLVAGPTFQAAVELADEEVQREDMNALIKDLPRPPAIAPWWWLLPPVAFLLARRRSRQVRELVMASVAPEDLRGFLRYLSKATGWIYVGIGGLLIAVKETWELCESNEWPAGVFVLLIFAGLGLCALNAAGHLHRRRQVAAQDG